METGNTPLVVFDALVVRAGTEEGARYLFQKLVAQVVRLQYPTVHEVQPRRGDEGIDAFVGELDRLASVWQAKFFIKGVGEQQRRDIRESFDAALEAARKNGLAIEAWTLCIPCSLDPATHRWWQQWKREQESTTGVSIYLWDETELRARLNTPDAAQLLRAHFGAGRIEALERRVEQLPNPTMYRDSLFVVQLEEAGHSEHDAARRDFYNAEILSREVHDKGIDEELVELESTTAALHSIWEHRFNDACSQTTDSRLPGLNTSVMSAVEDHHKSTLRRRLPAGLIHKFGMVHQIVDAGRAGWVRHYRGVAQRYGR